MTTSHLTILPLFNPEEKLLRMQKLDNEIKVLEAEYNMLKKELIGTYFVTHDEYRTSRGLLLATYKSYMSKIFNGKRFEKDFPDIYKEYKEDKTIFKFDLK